MTDGPSTPAGWYPAPHANNEQRYWDGEKWLDWTPEQAAAAHQEPAGAAAAAPVAAPTATATAIADPPPAKKKGLRWWAWVLIGLGALILLIIIIGSINGGGRDDDDVPAAQQSEVAEEEPAEEEPAEEEPAEEEPAEEEPVVAVERQAFKGTGDDVISVEISDPAIVTFRCPQCTSNTVVNTDGAESLIVNEIGAYEGQHLINVNDGSMTTRFTVEAEGAWSLVVDDLSTAKTFPDAAKGKGDSVVLMTGDFEVATVTNRGDSNFVVLAYGEGNFSPLIINEIGAYKGTVEMTGPAYVQVNSNGAWSIAPQQ